MTQRDHTTNAPPLSSVADRPRHGAGVSPVSAGGARTDDHHECAGQPDSAHLGSESREALEARCLRQAERIAELERDLHALSHTIRSPLVALKGFAGLLEEEAAGQLGDNGRHFLGRISEAGRRIELRLNDLAQLMTIAEQAPAAGWVDPVSIVEALAGEFKPALDDTGMRILVSQEPPLVYCDRAQLELALRHLIGNALQHGAPSEPRHVEIHIHRDDAGTHVSVTDSGPGMEPSVEQRAFDPFDCAGDRQRRFDDARESSGIGLALVERIAIAHGGTVRIETEPGRGTTVVINFPHE